MAIYHLTVSTGSKAAGQSAAAKLDYIQREGGYARDQAEVLHAESGNLPAWAEGNPRAYWEAADTGERANGRLYTQIEFALPAELTRPQQVEAVRRLAAAVTGKDRLPYSLAIHRGESKEEGKPDNPHCHLIVSERANDGVERTAGQWFRRANRKAPERGGAAKVAYTSSREWLENTREAWAEIANEQLERAGSAARIDERTKQAQLYDEMGEGWDDERTNPETGGRGYWTPEQEAKLEQLAQPAGRHLGPAASAIRRKGIEADRSLQLRAAALWEQTRARVAALAERLSEIGQGLAEQLDRALENSRAEDRRRVAPAPARPSLEERARNVAKPRKGPEFDFGR